MANTANSFAALLGAGGEAAISAGKKKKKSKSKKPPVSEDVDQDRGADRPVSAPVSVKGKKNQPSMGQTNRQSTNASANVTVEEAIRHVEKTAKETGARNSPRLWRAWAVELEAVQAGQGLRYTAADGAFLNFKQVLVKSCALEIAAETALELDTNSAQGDLSRLFGLCFPASSEFVPETLAELVFRLAVLITSLDSKILKLARQAIRAAVSTLKSGPSTSPMGPDESLWLPRLDVLERSLEAQAANLSKLESKTSSPALLKDKVSVSLEIVRLSEEKLDLLRTGGLVTDGAGSKNKEHAVAEIRNLRSMLQSLSTGPPKSGRKSSGNDQNLKKRHTQIMEEIRMAEAKLMSLRNELDEIEAQMHMGTNGVGHGSTDYGQHIMAVDALDALMQRSQEATLSREAEATASARTAESGAPSALLAAVERSLQALLAMQVDLKITLQGTLDKLVRNRRQAQQLAEMDGAAAAVESNRRVKDDLDRTMDKIQVDSELVLSNMKSVLDRLDVRGDVMKKLPGHASRLPFYGSIDALVAELQAQNDDIAARLAKRFEDPQPRKSRMATLVSAESMSSEDRVKQLEDMLKAANADIMHKDEQLAKFREATPAVDNGHGPSPISNVKAKPTVESASAVSPSQVPTVAEAVPDQVVDLGPPKSTAAKVPADSQTRQSAEPHTAPKAAPRGWGKVETAPVVLDDTMPSLADSMAASKGKRSNSKR